MMVSVFDPKRALEIESDPFPAIPCVAASRIRGHSPTVATDALNNNNCGRWSASPISARG